MAPTAAPTVDVDPTADDRPIRVGLGLTQARLTISEAETFLLQTRLAVTQAKARAKAPRPVVAEMRLPYRD